MDLEGVHLEEECVHPEEEGLPLEEERGHQKDGEVSLEDSQLSLSFQGYVAELRQCQNKMKMKVQGAEHGGRRPPGGADCTMDLYKATVVWNLFTSTHILTAALWKPEPLTSIGKQWSCM